MDNAIGFATAYPLDSDISGGLRSNPPFEQPEPGTINVLNSVACEEARGLGARVIRNSYA